MLFAGNSIEALACDLDTHRNYAIDAGLLSNTLLDIGRINRCVIVFEPGLIVEKRSKSVRGQLTGYEAARQALDASGFELSRTANGTLKLLPSNIKIRNAKAETGV
ncbi:STN domain-containing protein [Pseudomonas lurida]|uniref:STN domain-containing protein n=1 Tax=Pseudomonas lurida TaxID=244566 RepID=UPI000A6E221A|nr:STN domain-containing protein [Pseudomonas lurida]